MTTTRRCSDSYAGPVSDYASLADRLDAVASDLDDLAFDRLREAVADGELVRPADDKRLMQARRAIAKAVGILRGLDELAGDQADWST